MWSAPINVFEATLYITQYHSGCFENPPWHHQRCDCFIINRNDRLTASELQQLARAVNLVDNDWVEVYGYRAQEIHDQIDRASVEAGRQHAAGDGHPMTAWYDEIDFGDLVSRIVYGGHGCMPVKAVAIIGDDDVSRHLEERVREFIDQKL